MKTLLWLMLALSIGTSAYALECPRPPDGASLEVTGLGEVQSAGLDYDGDVATLFDACIQRGAWLVLFPELRVTNPDTEARLEAANAILQTEGASGSVHQVSGTAQALGFTDARLELTPAYTLKGFPAARYTASAASGVLRENGLELTAVELNRFAADGGGILERYSATRAELRDQQGSLSGVTLRQTNLALSAENASNSDTGFTANAVTGRVGRNSSGSEITFSAGSAVRLESGALQFQGAVVYLFGTPIALGGVTYDPNCPLEMPLVISPFAGWTLGVNNMHFGCRGNASATIIGYNIFSSQPTYVAFMTVSDGPLSLYAGQRLGETLYAQLLQNSLSGLIGRFTLDSGMNLEQTLNNQRFFETRFGVAQTFSWSTLGFRPTLEVGLAGQSLPSNPATDTNQFFVSAGVSAAAQVGVGPVSFSASGVSSYTLFSDGSSGANVALTLGANLNIQPFSVGLSVRYQQQLVPAVITRYNLDSYTYLDASLRITPDLGAAPLGFAGVRLEQPLFDVFVEYNPRSAVFVNQRFTLQGTLAVYDGHILLDNFGQPFQTPVFALSPRGVYDLVTGAGEFGSLFSISGVALIYDVGVFVTLPSWAFNFSFGVRLR